MTVATETDWPERYRRALSQMAASTVELDDDQVRAVLQLARAVAHGEERRAAPLAAFLAGQYVASRRPQVSVTAALDEAQRLAETLLRAQRADETKRQD